jgi:ABC-type branched-subunit amino acid transport system ATPase component/predicted MFS family arabinose efflux permease
VRRASASIRGLPNYLAGERWFPIIVIFLLNAVDEFDSRTFELLGPEIADEFNVGVGAFGLITVFAILLVPLVSVPVSYLSDRWKRMPLAIAGAAAWGAFSLASGVAPGLALFMIARVGSGFGKVVNEPVHGALISDFYSPATRAKAFGLHYLANPVGAFVASLLAGFIAEAFGWRVPFLVLTIPTVIALVVATRLKEPARGRFEILETPKAPPFMITASRLWAVRSLRFQWIGLAFTSGSILGLGVLVPFFLRQEFGVGPAHRGIITGIGTALGGIAAVIGTAVAQKKINQRPSSGLRLLCWTGVVAGIGLVGMAIGPNLVIVLVSLWTIMAVFAFVTPGLRAVTAIVAPPEIRAMAFALAGLVALAGAGFAVAGFLIGDAAGLRWALIVMAPVFLRGVLYFFKAANYLDDDVERLDPAHVEKARVGPDKEGPVLLEVSKLRVSYDGVQVLFGVDLEIRKGEIVALLGTNGAGKSTVLNAISGIVEPDGGNVWFDGEAVTGEAPERTAARGIIQVPGGRGIFPGLTVEENLKMGSFLIRRNAPLVAERMQEVLSLFPRLDDRKSQRAGLLSGGERQMLTLGQSFVLRPKLLMIDELSLGLAPTLVQELLASVRRMNESGITVLLVEQSVNLALTLAHRAYFMEKGEVRFSGPTAELFDRGDLLRSVFLEGAGAGALDAAAPVADGRRKPKSAVKSSGRRR